MKIKKIPFYLTQWFLMAGASLTIGLLSFGGILAVWPILPVAFAAFVLSVGYEGEIYLQNIKGSLKKLFKSNHLERQLAKACLLENFPLTKNGVRAEKDCPQFFKDYARQLHLLHRFEDKRLDAANTKSKRRVEKTLIDMEKWFAVQLFSNEKEEDLTPYQQVLRTWLENHKNGSLRDACMAKRDMRSGVYQAVKVFCLAAGVFMGLGTSYLLVEAFAVIPWLAVLPMTALPVLIVPMAVVAGVAYGMLVYNAMTDMIANEIFSTWYRKFSEYQKIEHKIIMGMVLSVMLTLTVALCICTAGTWWTVAKNTPPLFAWMGRMPAFIMLVVNPFISSISTWVFNVENVSETLELAEERLEETITWLQTLPSLMMQRLRRLFTRAQEANDDDLADTSIDLYVEENALQKRNPFRKLIQMTFDPLRKLLFAGHLISVSATADRMPGVWPSISMALAFGNEFAEDVHYFEMDGQTTRPHKDDTRTLLKERLSAGGGHNHDGDIPTKFLTAMFMPLYLLAASWDSLASRGNQVPLKKLGFWEALDKQMGLTPIVTVDLLANNPCRSQSPFLFPQDWQVEHTMHRINRHIEKNLQGAWFDAATAQEKINQLTVLKTEIKSSRRLCGSTIKSVDTVINEHLADKSIYDKHRLFGLNQPSPQTKTRGFLGELSSRVAMLG